MICEYEGCNQTKKQVIRGVAGLKRGRKYYLKYCPEHLSLTNPNRGKLKRPDRFIDQNGYVMIVVDGKRISEHKYKLELLLKRPLMKHESVHHINGIRHDNRDENLELWVGAIRYGQRAKDIVCQHCGKPYAV